MHETPLENPGFPIYSLNLKTLARKKTTNVNQHVFWTAALKTLWTITT
jgi:hypothetical protein